MQSIFIWKGKFIPFIPEKGGLIRERDLFEREGLIKHFLHLSGLQLTMQMLQCPFDIQTLFLSTPPKIYLFADKGVESVQLLLEECTFESKILI